MKRVYRWTIASTPDPLLTAQLAKEINVSETIARILIRRGITSYQEAKEFFRPELSNLHDPFLMDGMTRAVERVMKALETKERILIFGDYDVDGTNSAAMLYLYFTQLGAETIFHIPDRIKEGYGISTTGIDRGKEFGATLLISVDCGITAVEQVKYARSLGIDVIICDHHEPGEEIPDAHAVLDPLKPNCPYPFKHLCGCGVGFKLMQAIARHRGEEETVFSYIDFATLATTADIVPLIGENRILTRIGLQQINANPRPGIRALIDTSGTQSGKVTTGQIVFVLAPRINAAGRLGDATRAVKLLTSEDLQTALEMAQVLEEENRNRRKIDEDTFLKAQELVENLLQVDTNPAIVLHHEQWHPGVIGIVASRLVEKYYRPTIMMTTVDGVAKGSARSIVGFDIHKALKRVEDKLIQFGGHKYAAGLAVSLDRLDEFRDAFNLAVEELMSEDVRTPELKIDTEISLGELTPRFLRILKEFAPFGPGNMRSIFLVKNVELVGIPRIVGKDHLRFKVRQNHNVLDAIGFGLGSMIDEVRTNGKSLDVVFSVDEHGWAPAGSGNPETFPQLKVKDFRKHSTTDSATVSLPAEA
ncbi:MAG: single-stranded-DNA-specific exonuclease RecJ [Ignavibacteria bacterium]|nr:single-stranded-DNA-specific exonuclease RecJ [Ignavibacteria bacterium]MBI3766833.1 single-stranded-DNA-specific exonuclease RecJ [Ignavibacteriales bacterium]